jgi:hypothetical protein
MLKVAGRLKAGDQFRSGARSFGDENFNDCGFIFEGGFVDRLPFAFGEAASKWVFPIDFESLMTIQGNCDSFHELMLRIGRQKRNAMQIMQSTLTYNQGLIFSKSFRSPMGMHLAPATIVRSNPESTAPAPASNQRSTPFAARYSIDSIQRTGFGTC